MKNNILIFLTFISITLITSCEKDTLEEIKLESEALNKNRLITVTPKEVGGSNYVMFDTQGYQNTGVWSSPDNLKLVVGHYHLDPAKVNTQLRTMYQNGQRKIALMIWYTHFPSHWPNSDTHIHTIRSNAYRLPAQQEQNLKNVLGLIKSIGYNEVVLRFAQQGLADPGGWSSWNETQFQENWNFIYHAINTTETKLGNPSSIKRVYDLGVELGGITRGQSIPYVDKLWRNFSFRFPHLKSTGFSVAYAPGRLDKLIKTLKPTGRTPNEYAIDIYGGASNAIRTVKNELSRNGDANKTVVIQETYYNDALQYNQFISSIKSNRLNVRYIMQWPLRRNYHRAHFSENYPRYFDNYLPLDVEHTGR
ncbi:hypothetical protein M0D21_00195 [Aquimarina sp. D1M17]|uniref:hypothetical protein n=1 Tax=Aquimarina acroporae TaxID=2937283 RepID=UPI0020BF33D3|nr:hypothetical protein [Aquimarina acroporae]MCK8519968.1 hypothetical protein [Aquimarina acroporae]